MREIKFRMWTGAKMLYDDKEVIECLKQQRFFDTKIKLQPELGIWPYDHVSDNSDFMQFTGLKDSNGKEIYEGDILEYDLSEDAGHPELERGVVHFSPAGFWTSQDDNHLQEVLSEELESFPTLVIGNVHQNPELI